MQILFVPACGRFELVKMNEAEAECDLQSRRIQARRDTPAKDSNLILDQSGVRRYYRKENGAPDVRGSHPSLTAPSSGIRHV